MEMLDVELQELNKGEEGATVVPASVDMIRNVQVDLRVSVGRARLTVEELFSLKQGDLVALNRTVDEPVEIFLNNDLVARGVLASKGDSLGVRIIEISNAAQTL